MTTLGWIIIIIFAVIIGWIISIFNSLIRASQRTDEAWADIEVQLKRRHDLIPNLVEVVKGYAAHEKELFEKVAQARSEAMQAKTVGERARAENALSESLKSLFAVSEAYPNLRASENFLELQRELADTENKIQAARRFYNANVRDFNIKIGLFPNSLIARSLKFNKKEFFEIEEKAEREPVKIAF